MDIMTEEFVGDIHIKVFKSPEGKKYFNIQADNDILLPVTYVIEDALFLY